MTRRYLFMDVAVWSLPLTLSSLRDPNPCQEASVSSQGHMTGSKCSLVRTGSAELDRATLLILYEETGGDSWREKRGWKSAKPIGEWEGVTVDEQGRVTGLVLAFNKLRGGWTAAKGDIERRALVSHGTESGAMHGTRPYTPGGNTGTALGAHATHEDVHPAVNPDR